MNGRNAKSKSTSGLLPFKCQHGGRREGAGRKPTGKAGISHREREALASRFPVHVTVKLKQGLPRLRRRSEYTALLPLRRPQRPPALPRRSPGPHRAEPRSARSAGPHRRSLNKLWSRRGKVFADRYHDRILKTPRETRNAIRYVLANGKKLAAQGREVAVPQAIDTYTSAPWFDGFHETITVRGLEAVIRPVTSARTWMLTLGWRRHGLLSVHELPATG